VILIKVIFAEFICEAFRVDGLMARFAVVATLDMIAHVLDDNEGGTVMAKKQKNRVGIQALRGAFEPAPYGAEAVNRAKTAVKNACTGRGPPSTPRHLLKSRL
jgi:hypothetical protein